MFQGYLILIVSQIDLLSKWPPLPNNVGKEGQRIEQRGPVVFVLTLWKYTLHAGCPHLGNFYFFDTQVH